MGLISGTRNACLLVAVSLVSGCASQGMYYWGDYESAMYGHYATPADSEFKGALWEIITTAKTRRQRIPPGVQAEYGYLLLAEGKHAEARGFFENEKRSWPESTAFMDRMIEVASRTNTQEPASTEEAQ